MYTPVYTCSVPIVCFFFISAIAVDCEWRYSNYSECVEERQFIFPIILMYPKNGGLPCPRFVLEGQPVSRLCYDANKTGMISCFFQRVVYVYL